MATKTNLHRFSCVGWTPTYGFGRYAIRYRVRFVKERYRRLLALVFAALITLIIGTVVVSLQPIDTWMKTAVTGMVSMGGMTFIALIFGVEVNDVSLTREGAVLNFGESEDSEE